MKYVCDGTGDKTWFRIVTDAEAIQESELMRHAVEKYFRSEWQKAAQAYQPVSRIVIEQDIGLGAHIQNTMPWFVTLRDGEGTGLATAMLPPGGIEQSGFRPIVVGPTNADPYPAHGASIEKLGAHFGLSLDRERCFPYRRG